MIVLINAMRIHSIKYFFFYFFRSDFWLILIHKFSFPHISNLTSLQWVQSSSISISKSHWNVWKNGCNIRWFLNLQRYLYALKIRKPRIGDTNCKEERDNIQDCTLTVANERSNSTGKNMTISSSRATRRRIRCPGVPPHFPSPPRQPVPPTSPQHSLKLFPSLYLA